MRLKEKIIYLKVIMGKKINKMLQSNKTAYITGNRDRNLMVLERFSDLYLTDHFDSILIVMNKFNMNKKEELIEIIRYLAKKDKKIEIIEEERVLTHNDIKYLANINDKIILNNIYIEHSKFLARNEILQCDILSYLLIMEKVEYLVNVCKVNFSTQEEQIIFTLVQISDYIRYGKTKDYYRPCLVNAFLMRVGVCIDLSIAFWKVLTELGIECKLITGIANENNNQNVLIDQDHAWNQVKMNDEWYNVELTWFNTEQKTDMLLVDDKQFSVEGAHKVIHFDNREECVKTFDREQLEKQLQEFRKYKNVLREYDMGERRIVLKFNDE